MYTYFSTCVSGTNPIVEKILRTKLKDLSVTVNIDGLLVYTTESLPEEVKQLRGLNNSFLLVKLYKNAQPITAEKLIKQTLGEPKILQSITQNISSKQFTFRIVTSEENHMVSVNNALIEQLEERIGHRSHLKPNRRNPQNEIWFLTRSEGYSFIGIRLTRSSNTEKSLAQGELSPELAHLLCNISEPDKDDVILDPFAGHGAIPIERTNSKSKEIVAIEKDKERVSELKEKVAKLNKKITIYQGDATNFSQIANESIDKIITDPPWGAYDTDLDIPKLYEKMLKECIRVTKPSGIIVILTAQKETLLKISRSSKQLELIEQYDILVSGKKAGIYKYKRI